MAIKGCKIKEVPGGYAVKNTVFEHRYNAEIYAYYLRCVLSNNGKIHYVKDRDEAIGLILKNENRTDKSDSQRLWLESCWRRNENKYLHVASGMYAVDNLKEN